MPQVATLRKYQEPARAQRRTTSFLRTRSTSRDPSFHFAFPFWGLLIAAILAFAARDAVAGWVLEGRVVAIADGDTLTLLDRAKSQHKIRLSGIDAPEKGQAFGALAHENLSRLIFGREIRADCHKRDRYGRDEVCKVMHDLNDVGLEQIEAGMAWWYREYAKEQSAGDRASYAAAEDDARAMQRGLWTDAKPVPPWEWRRKNSSKAVQK